MFCAHPGVVPHNLCMIAALISALAELSFTELRLLLPWMLLLLWGSAELVLAIRSKQRQQLIASVAATLPCVVMFFGAPLVWSLWSR